MTWNKDMSAAPRDGTVVLVKNAMMTEPVEARWGEYRSRVVPNVTMQWVLVRDSDRFMPLPPGTLVRPDEWMSLPDPPTP